MSQYQSERSAEERAGDGRGPERRRWRMQPTLLTLEDRRLLSTCTVNSTGDSGSGSGLVGDLRYCITQANSAGGDRDDHLRPDSLQHAADDHPDRHPARAERHERDRDDHGTVGGRDDQRQQREPGVPGRPERHRVDLGTDDQRGPVPPATAAACTTRGTTTLIDCTVSGNTAGNGGGTAQGGGIFNSGTLSLTNSTISGNRPPTATTTPVYGGGIFNSGLLTVTGSTISGNSARISRRRRHRELRRHGHADRHDRRRQ